MICPNCEKTIKDCIAQCPHCGCHFPVKENNEKISNKQEETLVVPPAVEGILIKDENILPPIAESNSEIEEKQEKKLPSQIEEEQEVSVRDIPETEVEFFEETVVQKSDSKFCKNCGKEIKSTAFFCKYCGKQCE